MPIKIANHPLIASTMESSETLPFRFRLGLVRLLVRWLARPTVKRPAKISGSVIFALAKFSVFDVALLHATMRHIDDYKRHLPYGYFTRANGLDRKFIVLSNAENIERFSAQLLDQNATQAFIIPVSCFWGRAEHRDGSFLRFLVSEELGPTLALRKILCLLLCRRDILIDFDDPLIWNVASDRGHDSEGNLRQIQNQLKVKFKQVRYAAIGPKLRSRRAIAEQVVRRVDPKHTLPQQEHRSIHREVRQMASYLSYPIMLFLRRLLGWYFDRVYQQLTIDGLENIQELARSHTLIYVPNHRSQIDYLALSYLLFQNGYAIPQIAAGENLNIPFVGPILRRCGAFFIRRSYRGDLRYRAILAAYLGTCLERGKNLGFFIEGGRSRTGFLLEPRFGFLKMLLENRLEFSQSKLALVPIHISYERVDEIRDYLNELQGAPKTPESLKELYRAIRPIFSQHRHRGNITVRVGRTVRLDEILDFNYAREEIGQLGQSICDRINNIAVLTAVNVLGLAWPKLGIDHLSESDLQSDIAIMLEQFNTFARLSNFTLTHSQPNEIIERCVEIGIVERLGEGHEAVIRLVASRARVLRWFANNSIHLLTLPALILAAVKGAETSISKRDCVLQVNLFGRLVKHHINTQIGVSAIRRALQLLLHNKLLQLDAHGALSENTNFDKRVVASKVRNLINPMLIQVYVILRVVVTHQSAYATVDKLANQAWTVSRKLAENQLYEFPEYIERKFFDRAVEQLVATRCLNRRRDAPLVCSELGTDLGSRLRTLVPVAYQQSLDTTLMS